MRNNENVYEDNTDSFSRFLASTYLHLFLGLLQTGAVAYFGYGLLMSLYASFMGMFIVMALQLGLCFYFSSRLMTMSKTTAMFCFYMYSFITGVTLSYVPLLYDGASLALAVLITAAVFGSMAVIGYTTNTDLSKFGSYFVVGLFAIIIATVINGLFIHSAGIDMFITYGAIIVFLGLVAYDMQKLRTFYASSIYDDEMSTKKALFGAFELYLDFINLFIYILRIFGRRNND